MDDAGKKFHAGILCEHHNRQQVNSAFLISLKNNFAFHPIGKVANSSIKGLLIEAESQALGMQYASHDITLSNVHSPLFGPLLRPVQLRQPQFLRIMNNPAVFKFIFVRDPIHRVVSCFLDRIQAKISVPYNAVAKALGYSNGEDIGFAEFVDFISTQTIKEMNPHWRPQYYDAFCDRIDYNRICKLENFRPEMDEVLKTIYPNRKLDLDYERNLSPAKTEAGMRAEAVVTPELRAKLEAIYKVDIDAFGYA